MHLIVTADTCTLAFLLSYARNLGITWEAMACCHRVPESHFILLLPILLHLIPRKVYLHDLGMLFFPRTAGERRQGHGQKLSHCPQLILVT